MEEVDYGVDAPTVIRNLFIFGVILLIASFLPPFFPLNHISETVSWTIFAVGITLLLEGVLMLRYSRKGKYKHRERILALHNWTGNETVLDVGTGSGLLMIGAAKKLATGQAIGIDIWRGNDLSSNSIEKAMENAELEGVSDKIDIKNENIITTEFPANYFDVVVSNLCLHNIRDKEERQKACREIHRILKPGGTAIISDFKNNKEYREEFLKAGMKAEKIGSYYFDTFPPLTINKAVKN